MLNKYQIVLKIGGGGIVNRLDIPFLPRHSLYGNDIPFFPRHSLYGNKQNNDGDLWQSNPKI